MRARAFVDELKTQKLRHADFSEIRFSFLSEPRITHAHAGFSSESELPCRRTNIDKRFGRRPAAGRRRARAYGVVRLVSISGPEERFDDGVYRRDNETRRTTKSSDENERAYRTSDNDARREYIAAPLMRPSENINRPPLARIHQRRRHECSPGATDFAISSV